MECSIARQGLQFFDLPLDIRRIVYEEYLDDQCHPPAKIIHEEPLSAERQYWQPALLTVNKQMSDEVLHLCRIRTTFTCNITWQEFEYDMFMKFCIHARKERLHYGHMRHLRIEIYAPHPDRPMDMIHILEYVQELCGGLRMVERLHDLSIVFLEDEIASWSHNGKAKESMNLHWFAGPGDEFSDIGYVFDIFNMLTNIAKVTIHLPDSLVCDEKIHEDREVTVGRMMAPFDNDLGLTKANLHELKLSINEAKPRLKESTGQLSRATIEATCEYGLRKISMEDLHHLKTIWPYTDAVSDRDYFPDHKYTGMAPTTSLVESSVPPCTCLRKAPRDEGERKKALIKAMNNPKWYMCPRLRHEVSDILLSMNNCEV